MGSGESVGSTDENFTSCIEVLEPKPQQLIPTRSAETLELESSKATSSTSANSQGCQAPVSEAPMHQSHFGIMADLFLEASMKDESGSLYDVSMHKFIEAAEAYREAMSSLGTAVNLALQDFDGNLKPVKTAVEKDATANSTFRSYLDLEASRGYRACKFQWLLRGLEFFLTYLKLLFEGNASAASTSYSQTLSKYHAWKTSLGFKIVLLGLPSKRSICGMKQLCPDVHDASRLSRIVELDAVRAAGVALPVVSKMIDVFVELKLWDAAKV